MGEVVIAYDGDEAGQKATTELMFKVLDLSDTETGYLRSFTLEHNPFAEAVRLLTNRELADELAFWDRMHKAANLPDWWYEMSREHHSASLLEVTRRSRKLNDNRGEYDYIKNYNASHSISDVLEAYGTFGVPGRNAICPMHDDSTPSLSITKENNWVYCFNEACLLWGNGHGTDAFGLNKILSK